MKYDQIGPTHEYLSTACLHGKHEHCKAKVNLEGDPKDPACCKWCAEPCVCECHRFGPTQ